MKRISILLTTLCLALSCIACANNHIDADTSAAEASEEEEQSQTSQSNAQQISSAPEDLSIVDSGYVLTNGFIHYALEIENPNNDYLAQFANVNIVSRDTDGKILSSDDWVICSICPSTTTYWASQAGDGSIPDGAQVEINVSVNNGDWIETSTEFPTDLYTFSGTSLTTNDFGYLKGTGELTLNHDIELPLVNVDEPQIICILRDSGGKILTGFDTYTVSELDVDTPQAFEMESNFKSIEYSSFEFHANPW